MTMETGATMVGQLLKYDDATIYVATIFVATIYVATT